MCFCFFFVASGCEDNCHMSKKHEMKVQFILYKRKNEWFKVRKEGRMKAENNKRYYA